jgi:hypothetical protein
MKRIMLMVVACALVATASFAGEPALPGTLKAGDSDLVLNGQGVRTKAVLDFYVAGLYLPAKNKDMTAVLNNKDGKVAIKLHIISGMINSKNMSEATREGFEKSTKGNVAPIKKEIDEMINVFSAKINKNDVYDLVYEPGKGTSIYKNGALSKTIQGEEFRKALFGIWIGQDPVQAKLKTKLAGS